MASDRSAGDYEKGLRLTDDNYFAWHIKVKALLDQRDCYEAIDPGFGGEALYETFTAAEKKKNSRALSIILLSVSDKYIDYIGECQSAEKAWKTLQNMNQEFSLMQQIEFLEDLTTMKKSEGMSMTDYISKVLDLNRKVGKSGIVLSEHTLCLYLLRGLPKEKFEIFIRTMEYKEKLVLDNVISKLTVEEKRQMRENTHEVKALAVVGQADNYARKNWSSQTRRNNKNQRSDSYVHKPQEKEKVYKCYTCGKLGHISRECPDFKEFQKEKCNSRTAKSAVSTVHETSEVVQVVDKAKAYCSVGKKGTLKRKEWFLDSCCTDHMSPSLSDFTSLDDSTSGTIKMGNGDTALIAGKGSVVIKTPEQDGGLTVTLHEALYVPDLECALISVSKLTDKGLNVVFTDNKGLVLEGEELIFKSLKRDRVYVVNTESKSSEMISLTNLNGIACRATSEIKTWHNKLGHVNQDVLLKSPLLQLKNEEKFICDYCIEGKFAKFSFPKSRVEKSSEPLKIIHSDLMGKFTPASLGGSQYIMTMIDDYTRYITVKCLKSKSETFGEFVNFQKVVENLHGKNIMYLQSDNGTEYVNSDFKTHLENHGIVHRKTVPGCPQQNGVAERSNRTLMEMVRCMMLQAGVPKTFWAEAVMTAAYIRNRCPSSAIDNQIPFELWTNKKLTRDDMERIKVFGCRAWAKKMDGKKLDSKAEKCVMIGYEENTKDGYRLWSEERGCITVRRDVMFDESVFPFKQKEEVQLPNTQGECILDNIVELLYQGDGDDDEIPVDMLLEATQSMVSETIVGGEESSVDMLSQQSGTIIVEDNPVDVLSEQMQSDTIVHSPVDVLRRSQRLKKTKNCGCCAVAESKTIMDVNHGEHVMEEPQTPFQAIKSEHSSEWRRAMDIEIGNMSNNDVWEIVERPKDKSVVGSKWVFKIKHDEHGNVERFKARLVAQGFKKSMGFDWESTFSPVMKRRTVRILIAISVENGWVIDHVDVTCAYLNSPISTETYMEQPELYEEKGKHRDGYV
ncbi:hypothetical protein WDU94_008892 [Cyamophila willieti]